jgi:hypothetical protein
MGQNSGQVQKRVKRSPETHITVIKTCTTDRKQRKHTKEHIYQVSKRTHRVSLRIGAI